MSTNEQHRPLVGSRPVAVDMAVAARHLEQIEPDAPWQLTEPAAAEPAPSASMTWRPGQRWLVTSLDGGVGRSTVARAIAALLAAAAGDEADPTLLVSAADHPFAGGLPESAVSVHQHALGEPVPYDAAGVAALTARGDQDPLPPDWKGRVHRVITDHRGSVVIDGQAGPIARQHRDGSAVWCVAEGAPAWDSDDAVWVLVTPGDEPSLQRVARCLTAMTDAGFPTRERLAVIVNLHRSQRTRGSRARITALAVQCAELVTLPSDPALALTGGPIDPAALRRSTRRSLQTITNNPRVPIP